MPRASVAYPSMNRTTTAVTIQPTAPGKAMYTTATGPSSTAAVTGTRHRNRAARPTPMSAQTGNPTSPTTMARHVPA